jgi:hypothetical protein
LEAELSNSLKVIHRLLVFVDSLFGDMSEELKQALNKIHAVRRPPRRAGAAKPPAPAAATILPPVPKIAAVINWFGITDVPDVIEGQIDKRLQCVGSVT